MQLLNHVILILVLRYVRTCNVWCIIEAVQNKVDPCLLGWLCMVFHINEHFAYMNRGGSQGVQISETYMDPLFSDLQE